jgi:hypothetical protein
MRTREEYLEKSLTLTDSGTRTINLDFSDPVTEIVLQFDATNGATSNLYNPLRRNVTKVEVIDGGDVLWSAPGHILAGLFAHLHGTVPGEYYTEQGTDSPIEILPIRFGRYINDEMFAFNPRGFRNPQLKIEWNLANVRAVGATGYVTGSLKFTAKAMVMEDVPPPTHLLTAKDVQDFTTAASGDYRLDLPTDYPLRALLIRAYEKGVDLRSSLTNFKLSADGGKFVPFDISSGFLANQMLERLGVLTHSQNVRLVNDDFVQTYIGLSIQGQVQAQESPYFISTDAWWKSQVFMRVHNQAGAAAGPIRGVVTDFGTCYENCWVMPFGRLNDPESWLQAQAYESLRLYLTQGNADAAASVLVQEARPY